MRGARSRGAAFARAALLAVYALVLVVTPVLHHDLDCHFKTPTHCQACVANPMAAPPTVLPTVWSGPLPIAGRIDATRRTVPTKIVRVEIPGRAPPA
jgi:hypothetical protein